MSKTKMTINFEGMQYVRDKYADSKLTDTLFAAQMTKDLGHPYTVAKVRAYRYSLQIPNNIETKQTIAQELAEAKKHIQELLYFHGLSLAHMDPEERERHKEVAYAAHEFLSPTATES